MTQENVFQEFGRKSFRTLKNCLLGTTLACLTASPVLASDTRVALVPGGPHPYFAAWEKAGQDAKRDFGLSGAYYRVPQKLELSQQNQLLESLLTQGYNG